MFLLCANSVVFLFNSFWSGGEEDIVLVVTPLFDAPRYNGGSKKYYVDSLLFDANKSDMGESNGDYVSISVESGSC